MAKKKKKRESDQSGRESAAEASNAWMPEQLLRALAEVFSWSEESGYEAALIGGVAVGLLGPVRPTDDVDIVIITTDSPDTVFESLEEAGFEPRYKDAVEFALASRTLLMRHTGTAVPVDVVLGMLPFEMESMRRSVQRVIQGQSVRLFPAESLCVMKLIAGRPQDLRDVALLVETYPDLDRSWINEQLNQYAVLMEDPDALDRARRLISPSE